NPVTPKQLGDLINLVEKKLLNNNQAKKVLAILAEEGGDAEAVARDRVGIQETDTDAIREFVQQAIDANPGPVQEYRDGQAKALNFLIGQVMRFSKGKANPQ